MQQEETSLEPPLNELFLKCFTEALISNLLLNLMPQNALKSLRLVNQELKKKVDSHITKIDISPIPWNEREAAVIHFFWRCCSRPGCWPNLNTLVLRYTDLSKVLTVSKMNHFTSKFGRKLHTLDLSNCCLDYWNAKPLAALLGKHFKSVEILNLSRNNLQSNGIKRLAFNLRREKKFLRLKVLKLRRNSIEGGAGGDAVGQLADRCPALVELDISKNRDFSADGMKSLFEYTLPNVERLSLVSVGWSEKIGAPAAEKLPKLRSLNLSKNKILDISRAVYWFMGSRGSALEELDISDTGKNGGQIYLWRLHPGELLSLRALYLRKGRIYGIRLGYLFDANIAWSKLEILDLKDNELGVDGAEMLARAVSHNRLPSLKFLNLDGCLLSNLALAELTSAYWSRLESLILSSNHFGASGAAKLVENGVENFPRLRQLNIAYCEVRSAGYGIVLCEKWPHLDTVVVDLTFPERDREWMRLKAAEWTVEKSPGPEYDELIGGPRLRTGRMVLHRTFS